MILIAIMSSENRAASALGRTYPGGMSIFMKQMNKKAAKLGMNDSHFADPQIVAQQKLDFVWLFSDVMNGLMAVPNLIGLLLLSGVALRETRDYLARNP